MTTEVVTVATGESMSDSCRFFRWSGPSIDDSTEHGIHLGGALEWRRSILSVISGSRWVHRDAHRRLFDRLAAIDVYFTVRSILPR